MPSPAASTTLPFKRAPALKEAAVNEAAAELSEVFGSGNPEQTVPMLSMTVPEATDASTVATIEALTVAFTASVEKGTVRLFPAPPQTPAGALHEATLRPAGSTSLNVTLGAAAPDLFVAVSRKTAFEPGATLPTSTDLVT